MAVVQKAQVPGDEDEVGWLGRFELPGDLFH